MEKLWRFFSMHLLGNSSQLQNIGIMKATECWEKSTCETHATYAINKCRSENLNFLTWFCPKLGQNSTCDIKQPNDVEIFSLNCPEKVWRLSHGILERKIFAIFQVIPPFIFPLLEKVRNRTARAVLTKHSFLHPLPTSFCSNSNSQCSVSVC